MSTESVDLIYRDPPFNSSRSSNILFKNESDASSDAQITTFDDTWQWSGYWRGIKRKNLETRQWWRNSMLKSSRITR
jgi:adenine specific DNA methylase Mod